MVTRAIAMPLVKHSLLPTLRVLPEYSTCLNSLHRSHHDNCRSSNFELFLFSLDWAAMCDIKSSSSNFCMLFSIYVT